ncbi:hypothetical protein JHV675_51550 [Mycobacterium avium subsp. hominissuis]
MQNRAVAYPGEPLSFGGRVTGTRLDESGSGLVDLDIAGRRDDTVLMPGAATVQLPRRASARCRRAGRRCPNRPGRSRFRPAACR